MERTEGLQSSVMNGPSDIVITVKNGNIISRLAFVPVLKCYVNIRVQGVTQIFIKNDKGEAARTHFWT